jgi:hypothetical protein
MPNFGCCFSAQHKRQIEPINGHSMQPACIGL